VSDAMKNKKSFISSLLSVALFFTSIGNAFGTEPVPENDFEKLENQIRKVEKDTSAVQKWLEKNIKPLTNTNHMFSAELLKFRSDQAEVNWEGTMTEAQLREKWGARFDVKRLGDHPFETGNCGWESMKIAKFEHLGELNGGDWFRLTIRGGCRENDYSDTVKRVVKIVSENGKFQITNLVCL